jgi:hypothetical protein
MTRIQMITIDYKDVRLLVKQIDGVFLGYAFCGALSATQKALFAMA